MDQADKPSPERMAKQGNVRDQLTGSDEIDADFLLPGRLEERQGSRPGDMRGLIMFQVIALPSEHCCQRCSTAFAR